MSITEGSLQAKGICLRTAIPDAWPKRHEGGGELREVGGPGLVVSTSHGRDFGSNSE